MTYFGSASTPADPGANAGTTVTITPPGSMVAGDLVVVLVQYRNDTVTLTNSTSGGQTWIVAAGGAVAGMTMSLFYCIFNGTWGANPVFTNTTGVLALSGIMHVFRPTAGFHFVGHDDVGFFNGAVDYSAPSSPFDITSGTPTTTKSRLVVVTSFASSDDNTWALQSGTWTNAGSAQYRNTTGSDQSNSIAYKFFTSPGIIDAVTNRQATLGGDPTGVMQAGFFEVGGRSFGALID